MSASSQLSREREAGTYCSWCREDAPKRALFHYGGWAWLHRDRAACRAAFKAREQAAA